MPGKKDNAAAREKPRKAKKSSMPKGNAQTNKPQSDNQWDMNRTQQNRGNEQKWQERQPMGNPADPNRRTGEEVMEDEDTEMD